MRQKNNLKVKAVSPFLLLVVFILAGVTVVLITGALNEYSRFTGFSLQEILPENEAYVYGRVDPVPCPVEGCGENNGGGTGGGGSCSDDCSSGAVQCTSSGVRVCGNFDGDSCRDWSSFTPCPGGCNGNYCASYCYDSDVGSGSQYLFAGSVSGNTAGNSGNPAGVSFNNPDYCDDGFLNEYMCDNPNAPHQVSCDEGFVCSSNKCVPIPTFSCESYFLMAEPSASGVNILELDLDGQFVTLCNDVPAGGECDVHGITLQLSSFGSSATFLLPNQQSSFNRICYSNGNYGIITEGEGITNFDSQGNELYGLASTANLGVYGDGHYGSVGGTASVMLDVSPDNVLDNIFGNAFVVSRSAGMQCTDNSDCEYLNQQCGNFYSCQNNQCVVSGQSSCSACGNGIVEGEEECDLANFNGLTCSNYGYNSGALTCTSSCEVDSSGCYNSGGGGFTNKGSTLKNIVPN